MSPDEQKLLLQLAKLYGSTYAAMKAVDLGLNIEKKVYDLLERKKEEADREFKE